MTHKPTSYIALNDPDLEDRATERYEDKQTWAEADVVFLRVVYRIIGEPHPRLPFGGVLTDRMQLSERQIREHIIGGRLGYFCAAKKAYRVRELDVRRFEAGLPPLEQAA